MATSRLTSDVWRMNFDQVASSASGRNTYMARCRRCSAELRAGGRYGTSHLKRHVGTARCRQRQQQQRHEVALAPGAAPAPQASSQAGNQQQVHSAAGDPSSRAAGNHVHPSVTATATAGEPVHPGNQALSAPATTEPPQLMAIGNQPVYSTATPADGVMAAAEHLRLLQEEINDLRIDFSINFSGNIFADDPEGGEAADLGHFLPTDSDVVALVPQAPTRQSHHLLNDDAPGDLNGDPTSMMMDFEDDPDTMVQGHLQDF